MWDIVGFRFSFWCYCLPMKMFQALISISLLTLLSSCNAEFSKKPFDNSISPNPSSRNIVFVGRKIALKPDTNYTPEDSSIIFMDGRYLARYEILELVNGSYSGETIDFHVYDHYGEPSFSEYDIVQLYIREYDGELVHEKYTYDIVSPTDEGKWAFCGNPYLGHDENKIRPKPLKDITFKPPIVELLSDYSDSDKYNQAEIRAFLSEPVFEIEGNKATCRKGVYPDELLRIKNETQLLPRRRSEICRQKPEFHPKVFKTTAELDKYSSDFNQCIDELKKTGLP